MNVKIPFKIKNLFLFFLILFFLLIPSWINPYLINVLIIFFLYAYLSQCWNILGGYIGQLSLGHALFFGIGAYSSSILFVNYKLTPWIGMFIGGIAAAIVGLFIGFLCFRYGLKGPYFTLFTIAFAEVARMIALNMNFIGGATGLNVPLVDQQFVNFQFADRVIYYYIIYGMALFSIVVVYFLKNSFIGYYFRAIRENEIAAQAIGINSMKYKLIGITISAFMTAIGGTFYAQYFLYIEPNSTFGITVSIDILIRTVIGGTGTILGPFLGSTILTPLSELTRSIVTYGGTGIHLIIFSCILMITCIFFPSGLMSKIQYSLDNLKLKNRKYDL